MGDVVYLVTLTTGEYSDTRVRFLRVYDAESAAKIAALRFELALREMLVRISEAEDIGEYAEPTVEEVVAAGLHPEDVYWWEGLKNEPRYEVHRVSRGSL